MRATTAAAAALLLLAAAPARADETGERAFTVDVGGRDAELRADCSQRMSVWWAELTSPENPPKGWDAAEWGPWPLVARASGHAFHEERAGLVHVTVNVTSPELKSRRATATAYAQALLDGLRARVLARQAALREPERVRAQVQVLDAERRTAELGDEVAGLEKAHAGPPDRRAVLLAERLATTERDAAQARVDRAVTARKLETARSGVERAIELERLRRESEELPIALRAAADTETRSRLEGQIAALRLRIDQLFRGTPPLEMARQEAFRAEVDLVGLEARTAALDAEATALREEIARALGDARAYAPRARDLREAELALVRAREKVRAAAEAANERGSPFEVVRAPAPPAPAQEEKR